MNRQYRRGPPSKGSAARFLAGACLTLLFAPEPSRAGVDRWTLATPPAEVVFMAMGGGVLYATTLGGFYRSTDIGQSWALIGNPPPPHSVVIDLFAVDPWTPSILYGNRSGPNGGVFKSLDGGLTWLPSGTGLPQYALATFAIDPRDTSRIFAGVQSGFGSGIYFSANAGASWSLIPSGATNVTSILIDPTDSSRIYAIGDILPL